jgi:hypothetical protein
MSKLLKFFATQFGVDVSDEDEIEPAPAPIDPEARRQAEAEINGTLALAEHSGKLPRSMPSVAEVPAVDLFATKAIDNEGNIDFEMFFSKINFPHEDFTADHAIKVMANVEKTIPESISDTRDRKALLRNVLLGTMSGPAPDLRLVNDAKNRSDALTGLVRQRLNRSADYKQRVAQKIKELEDQVAAGNAAIAAVDRQFDTMAASCKDRQNQYDALIDLFVDASPQPATKP